MKLTSGYISLKNVRFFARHGVLPQERVTGGEFMVSVRIKYPFDNALLTDSIDDTANYAEVYEIMKTEMLKPSGLLEHVAGRIGSSIFEHMPEAESVDVEITKVNPPINADVMQSAVELHLINDKTI